MRRWLAESSLWGSSAPTTFLVRRFLEQRRRSGWVRDWFGKMISSARIASERESGYLFTN